MKPYLLVALIFLCTANKNFSQCFPDISTIKTSTTSKACTPQALAADLTQTMTGQLGLTEKQAIIVEAINLEGFQTLDEISAPVMADTKMVEKIVRKVERVREYKLKAALKSEQWYLYIRHTYAMYPISMDYASLPKDDF